MIRRTSNQVLNSFGNSNTQSYSQEWRCHHTGIGHQQGFSPPSPVFGQVLPREARCLPAFAGKLVHFPGQT